MSRVLLIALLATTAPAAAQHADVLVFDAGSKLGVGRYDFATQTAVERRVHVGRFDSIYSVNDPGFTTAAGVSLPPPRADVLWDFLPMTIDSGYRSTLLYWDGLGDEPLFGPTPTPDYELSLFGRDGPAAADGGDAIVPGGVLGRTASNGSLHEHRFFFLDDNGDGLNTTLPNAGVYLIAMRLSVDGLEASDPFVIVWGTPEASITPALGSAADWAQSRIDALFADGLPGDFNGDGFVDAADYTVWRDGLGEAFAQNDYDTWAKNYTTSTPGDPAAAAPEPSAALLASLALLFCQRPRRVMAVGTAR